MAQGLTLKQFIEKELQNNDFSPEWWETNKDAEIKRLCEVLQEYWRKSDSYDFIVGVVKRYRTIKPLFLRGLVKYHVPYSKRFKKEDISEAVKVLENNENATIRILCNKFGKIKKWCVEGEDRPLWYENDYGMTTEFFGKGGNVREYQHDTKCYKQVRETILSYLYGAQGVYRFEAKYITKTMLRRLDDKRRVKRRVELNRKRSLVKVCSEFYDYLLQSNIEVWIKYNGKPEGRGEQVKDFISDVLGEVFSEDFRRYIKKNIQ